MTTASIKDTVLQTMFSHFKKRRCQNRIKTFNASNDRSHFARNLSLYLPIYDFCIYQFSLNFRNIHFTDAL